MGSRARFVLVKYALQRCAPFFLGSCKRGSPPENCCAAAPLHGGGGTWPGTVCFLRRGGDGHSVSFTERTQGFPRLVSAAR